MRLIKTTLLTVVGLIAVLAIVVIATLRPNVPDSTVTLTPPSAVGNLNVLVFGATRNTGLEVTKLLTMRGDKVTAFVRPTSDRTALEPLGVDFAVGDAMEPESIDKAFDTSEFDAVLTTIGNLRANPPPDYQGNANIFDAAKRAGVERVIMVSTIGAGDSNSAAPWLSKLALSNTKLPNGASMSAPSDSLEQPRLKYMPVPVPLDARWLRASAKTRKHGCCWSRPAATARACSPACPPVTVS